MSDVEFARRRLAEIVDVQNVGDRLVDEGRDTLSDSSTSLRELSTGSQSALTNASVKAVDRGSERETISTPTRSLGDSISSYTDRSLSLSSLPSSIRTPLITPSLSRTSSVRTLEPSDPLNRKLKEFYRFVGSGLPLQRERSTYDMAVEIATLRAYEEVFNRLHGAQPIKLPQTEDDSSQPTQ